MVAASKKKWYCTRCQHTWCSHWPHSTCCPLCGNRRIRPFI